MSKFEMLFELPDRVVYLFTNRELALFTIGLTAGVLIGPLTVSDWLIAIFAGLVVALAAVAEYLERRANGASE